MVRGGEARSGKAVLLYRQEMDLALFDVVRLCHRYWHDRYAALQLYFQRRCNPDWMLLYLCSRQGGARSSSSCADVLFEKVELDQNALVFGK